MASYTIKHSTELMENYLQASVMSPQKEFRALQTPTGRALLFSIGDDDAGASFNVTAEATGERHGWSTVSLSAGHAQPCQHFAVAQRADGSIHLAMVLREGAAGDANDTLYMSPLALDESGDVVAPTWTAFPYDGADAPRPHVEIAGVFLSQATDGEYIIADVVRDPGSPTKEIVRYYIDSGMTEGRAWRLHDVPIDLETDGYGSVLGRRGGANVDGVYVSGQIDGSPQIVYTPLFNEVQRSKRPLSAYLKLTPAGDQVADAIAGCRNPDNTSDLYATAGGALYRFASDNQHNEATAIKVADNALFHRVKDLFAFDDGDRVVVWGRNADNVAFYTACPRDRLDSPGGWSIALPIVIGAQHVSPFVNRANGGNTIFAHTGDGQLKIGVKSPGTGSWSWRDVTLPVGELTVPAKKFSSYTTRIQVVDGHNQPAAGCTIALSATTVTSVYINHLYYQVGPSAIHVPTDATGSVTVVEAVPSLTGTRFTIAVVDGDSGDAAINPMDKAFKKATALQSVDQLRGAKITRYVNGQKLPPVDLIRSGVDDATLQQVALLNQQCAQAYANPKQGPHAMLMAALKDAPPPPFIVPADAPKVDAGDLFQFLETKSAGVQLRAARVEANAAVSTQESFWEMLIRWFEGAWEFVVKIGEAVYRCVLWVVEQVVSAVRWVFDKIVTAIKDLIEFLQYLFEWDDFKRTKDVIKNLTTVFVSHQIDQIPVIEKKFDAAVDELIAAIDKWAGLPPVSSLGDGRLSSAGNSDGPDAPGSLLAHHFQGNVGSASNAKDPATPDSPTSVLAALRKAMEGEEQTLGTAFDELEQLMRDAPTLSLVDILKRVAAILADTVLRSARVVIDASLDVLHVIAKDLLEFFDAPIHIPVISDILNAIGIPDFSMLDVVCWVAAVPATIAYKVGIALAGKEHQAPFPDNDETKFLIESKDFDAILAAFAGHATPLAAAALPASTEGKLAASDGLIAMSPLAVEAVFISLHATSGVCGWVSAFVDAFESMIPNQIVPKALTAATVVSALVGGVARGVANFLVPRYPLEGDLMINSSRLITVYFAVNKGAWGLLGYVLGKDDPWDTRAAGAYIDAVLALYAFGITTYHFVELAEKPAGTERTEAILDETSFVATYVSRVLYTVVVSGRLDSNPEAKLGFAAAMGVASVVHGALQLAEAAVEFAG